MLDSELIINLSKDIGIQPTHLFFFIGAILISIIAIIIAIILDSKQMSGKNFDAIKFRKNIPGVKSINNIPKDWNILKIQTFIKGKPSVTSTNAQIIQLAIWGYIQIKKEGDITEIHKTNKSTDDLSNELQLFYESLFDGRDMISNRRKILDKKKRVENMKLQQDIDRIVKEIKSDLVIEGYYKENYQNLLIMIKLLSIPLLLFSSTYIHTENFLTLLLLCTRYIVAFALLILNQKVFLQSLITEKGKTFLKEIQGLYLYIKTAEKDRINFHNNPNEYEGSFINLLPYALLFGMSDKWLRYLPLETTDWSDEDFSSW